MFHGNQKVRSSSLLSGAMSDIIAPKMNIKAQIFQVVKDAIKRTPHDITTHAGLANFKKEITPEILGGFPSERRNEVSKLIDEAITSHGEFHDINREKSEGEMKKGKKA